MKLRWIDSKSKQTLEVVLNLDVILQEIERNSRALPENARRVSPPTGGTLSANSKAESSVAGLR